MTDNAAEWVDKQFNPSQPRDERGRWTSSGAAAGMHALMSTVRTAAHSSKESLKRIARRAMKQSKPVVKVVGKAAYAGAMAGLVMGIEQAFGKSGSDVGQAVGAMAVAIAKEMKNQAENQSGMFVTAKVNKTKRTVRVQPAQTVKPNQEHYDMHAPKDPGPAHGSMQWDPWIADNSMSKAAPDDEVLIAMGLEDFDADKFTKACMDEIDTINKHFELRERLMA